MGFVPDGELVSDLNRNGKTVISVAEVANHEQQSLTVHNLSCHPYNTFLADGMWVHNCDTDFSQQYDMTSDELLTRASNWRADRGGSNLIVITGGEPLAQNLTLFLQAATRLGFHIQIETAGTLPLLRQGDPVPLISNHGCDPFPGHVSVVCSPKTPKLDRALIPLVNCYKYIVGHDDEIDADDGLPLTSTQRKGEYARLYRPTMQYQMRGNNLIKMFTRPIYIQPRDDGEPQANRANTVRALSVALDHGYRVSLQTHKILGLP